MMNSEVKVVLFISIPLLPLSHLGIPPLFFFNFAKEFSCSEFIQVKIMDENGSAFFRFLELPFKFIKRDVELAHKVAIFIKRDVELAPKVAISGFHEPSISAQNKITTHLKCYKNSSHLLDYGCTDSEINFVLMKHTNCCTPDDFPKTFSSNYASHRLHTFLKDEQPREAIYLLRLG
jgi:hypothetical protein